VRRLTFAYEGDQIRLMAEREVLMIIPPSDPLDPHETQSGFSVLLKNDRSETVYRRVMNSPLRFDEEVFDRDPERSIRRVDNPNARGTFVVLVPAIAATRLEFFGHPLKPRAHNEPPRRLASFTLAAPRR
jgi:hypothetical protein